MKWHWFWPVIISFMYLISSSFIRIRPPWKQRPCLLCAGRETGKDRGKYRLCLPKLLFSPLLLTGKSHVSHFLVSRASQYSRTGINSEELVLLTLDRYYNKERTKIFYLFPSVFCSLINTTLEVCNFWTRKMPM